MALSFNLYALKVQTGKDLSANSGSKSARMAELWQFGKLTLNPHFLKKCKGGSKRNFSKITQKVPLLEKSKKTLNQMAVSSN